jgi:hypothetical protein
MSIALRKRLKWQMAPTLCFGIRDSLSFIAVKKASVPSEPTKEMRQVLLRLAKRVDVVAADPAQQLRHSQRDFVGVFRVQLSHRLRELGQSRRYAAQVHW